MPIQSKTALKESSDEKSEENNVVIVSTVTSNVITSPKPVDKDSESEEETYEPLYYQIVGTLANKLPFVNCNILQVDLKELDVKQTKPEDILKTIDPDAETDFFLTISNNARFVLSDELC